VLVEVWLRRFRRTHGWVVLFITIEDVENAGVGGKKDELGGKCRDGGRLDWGTFHRERVGFSIDEPKIER
jgi:hypothetical protein